MLLEERTMESIRRRVTQFEEAHRKFTPYQKRVMAKFGDWVVLGNRPVAPHKLAGLTPIDDSKGSNDTRAVVAIVYNGGIPMAYGSSGQN